MLVSGRVILIKGFFNEKGHITAAAPLLRCHTHYETTGSAFQISSPPQIMFHGKFVSTPLVVGLLVKRVHVFCTYMYLCTNADPYTSMTYTSYFFVWYIIYICIYIYMHYIILIKRTATYQHYDIWKVSPVTLEPSTSWDFPFHPFKRWMRRSPKSTRIFVPS